MKKMITMTLALALACSLAACGGNVDSTTGKTPPEGSGTVAVGGSGGEDIMSADYEFLFGKVTSIVGNEIELALAEMPEVETPPVEEDTAGENDIPEGTVSAATGTIAVDPSSNAGENMEFTGETLTITIPAGVQIYSMGQETTLSALKKGSLVSVMVDNLEDLNIQVVDVMS